MCLRPGQAIPKALKKASVATLLAYEPQRDRTGVWGFRPGLTQTGLCNHLKKLEA